MLQRGLMIAVGLLGGIHSAQAHGIAGNRFFPVTLTFDDPAVASYKDNMSVLIKTPRLARFRSRFLAMFCVALTLSLGATSVVSATESAHHELEVAQAGSSVGIVFCLGDDQSCGLPEHDEDHVVPHLHIADLGLVGLPALESPTTTHHLVSVRLPLPSCRVIDGLKQQTPERPPRTTCI